MGMRRPAALALLAAVLAGCGGGVGPDVPEGYATYRVEGVALRHPAGWTAERAAAQRDRPGTTIVLRPAGANPDAPGPDATLTIETRRRGVAEEVRAARTAFGGRAQRLSVEIPGADDAGGVKASSKDEASAAFVAAAQGDRLVRVLARAPAGTKGVDVEAIAGSLRLR
jgi:hypothetical protein